MDDEREFRLRPRKPVVRNERATWARAFKTVIHHARMTSRQRGHRVAPRRTFQQRCAVRVTYSKAGVSGQWRAHGRYIARESASTGLRPTEAGFDHATDRIDVSRRLNEWQQAGDERIWKVIVSPEFGERVDLQRLTRGMMERMESDLGTRFQWVAVQHHNTDHSHVHVALRGIRDDGTALEFQPTYIKQRIREIAGDLCTRQIGHRSQADADLALRREVDQCRVTSMDRTIKNKLAPQIGTGVQVLNLDDSARKRMIPERLRFLALMGLAAELNANQWQVREDFDQVLRAMQLSRDHQRLLAAHGAAVSDSRLPVSVLDLRRLSVVEGRVLVHGENETSGRGYLLLEGVEGRIHHICHTPELEALRCRGCLRANTFLRISRRSAGETDWDIEELGDAERILKDQRYLRSAIQRLLSRGVVPSEDGWQGWLGRYQKALCKAALGLDEQSGKNPTRGRGNDFAR